MGRMSSVFVGSLQTIVFMAADTQSLASLLLTINDQMMLLPVHMWNQGCMVCSTSILGIIEY